MSSDTQQTTTEEDFDLEAMVREITDGQDTTTNVQVADGTAATASSKSGN